MKFLRFLATLLLFSMLLYMSSCIVVLKKDNGKHKGWYKNTNNPHNPLTTNPARGNKKH